MINNYFNRLSNYNYSERTIENYKLCLTKFSDFCKNVAFYDIGEFPERINKSHIAMFVSNLKNIKQVDPKTINLYLHAIRSYLKFLYVEEERVVLDHKRIILLKEDQKPINYLEKQEIEKLISCAKKEKEPLKRVRNSLMIKMLYTTGLRVGELINIKFQELKPEMQIIGKGRKIRTVYIPDEIIKLSEYYIRRRQQKIKSDYLFVSHSKNSLGKPLTRNSVEFYMKKYGLYCGINKKTNPHVLRHSFATEIYRKGALSKDVQTLLGHAHLVTTEKYLRTNCEYIKKAAMLAR